MEKTAQDLSALTNKLSEKISHLKNLSKRFSNYRLFILTAGIIIFLVLFFAVSQIWSAISFGITVVVLAFVAHFHSKLDRSIKKWELWIKIKSSHLARLNLDWENIPPIDYSHSQKLLPNEIDLNIAGEKSLHQLINTGTSTAAKFLLRQWLNNLNPSIDQICHRQRLINELIPLTRFRDKLTLYSISASTKEFDSPRLTELLKQKNILSISFKVIFITLIILAPLNIFLFLLSILASFPPYWIILTIVYIELFHLGNKNKNMFFDSADYLTQEMQRMENVFEFLETYNYKKESGLAELSSPFLKDETPSYIIEKMKKAVEFMRLRKGNPLIWNLMRAVFPVDLYFNLKLSKYKNLISDNITEWLETWYNLEALSSLANFAYLNPEYSFPEIVETGKEKEIIFNAEQLAHPLLKKEKKITNDFLFDRTGEIVLITGSNMSGKSTFIRTLGVNLSLAYAGSVVNAKAFNVSLYRLFTCISVSDSLAYGISYFYAEVKRLKTLLDEIKNPGLPVFFLIDEIFRGTNNIERLKGGYAFIKTLSGKNTLGVLATHDLELVQLSSKINGARNYHFREEIKDGKMFFNYKLQPGPCPTTNALKIMQLEGLPIE